MKHTLSTLVQTTGSALTTVAAGFVVTLMVVPLTFFLAACWVDSKAHRRRARSVAQRMADRARAVTRPRPAIRPT